MGSADPARRTDDVRHGNLVRLVAVVTVGCVGIRSGQQGMGRGRYCAAILFSRWNCPSVTAWTTRCTCRTLRTGLILISETRDSSRAARRNSVALVGTRSRGTGKDSEPAFAGCSSSSS